jgi:hypothetical protein
MSTDNGLNPSVIITDELESWARRRQIPEVIAHVSRLLVARSEVAEHIRQAGGKPIPGRCLCGKVISKNKTSCKACFDLAQLRKDVAELNRQIADMPWPKDLEYR